MKIKRWVCLLMALVLMLMLPTVAMAAKKASIKLPAKVGLMYVDGQVTLKTKLTGVKSEDLKFTSSNETVATVSDAGVIKAISQGKVTITVSAGSAKAKCAIVVVPKTLSIQVGEKVTLPAVSGMQFKMKNAKIARVSAKGVVKGVKAGSTKLAVGYGKQKKAITVEVSQKTADSDSKVAGLDAASQTDQIVLVEYKSGSKAVLSVHQKQDGHWKQLMKTGAYVGKNGIDKTKEGDKRTPTGTFNLTTPFGIKADPGAKMTYTKVTKYHYWCGTSGSEYYNKLVDTRETGSKYSKSKSDEHLIDYKGYYNYALFIDYNAEGAAEKGSCIFLHCTGGKKYTAGCVAISEPYMRKIVQWAKDGAKIVIKKAA